MGKFPFPSEELDWEGDLSLRLNRALHAWLERETTASVERRQQYWQRDFSSPEAYARALAPRRERLAEIVGAVDQRRPARPEYFAGVGEDGVAGRGEGWEARRVRWQVLEGVQGEGLLLTPEGRARGGVVLLPDAEQTPEQLAGLEGGVAAESQMARRLAEAGFQVLAMALISRESALSRGPFTGPTDQPHREWIYRQAFQMGRHPIGFEVQKALSAAAWLRAQGGRVGVAGYGEGGLLALYAAALDEGVDAALVSGYFRAREGLWMEPVYRNVWGLLKEFGDAEIASMVAPRGLVVEYSPEPRVDLPAPLGHPPGRTAAPGLLHTPPFAQVEAEWARLGALVGPVSQERHLVSGAGGTPLPFGSEQALSRFAGLLGAEWSAVGKGPPALCRPSGENAARQERQVRQLEQWVQRQVRLSDAARQAFFLEKVERRSPGQFARAAAPYREHFHDEVLGRLEAPLKEPRPRARKVYQAEGWSGYEVVLDAWDEVFVWGILCVPEGIGAGERRPAVVCQHGLGGEPRDTIEDTADGRTYYRRFAARLAERGFVTFAPHNPYRGEYRYILLQRRLNPLGLSLGSVIVALHAQILRWLKGLPFVDGERIGFYGLSYGGWTAMRAPPLLEGYALSICSACFNDWTRKVAGLDHVCSYMGHPWVEMVEWNAGHTFSNAEMAYLMAPRPFMVERGSRDGVAPDEWVAYEFAKVRRLYAELGMAERVRLEIFDGEHCIHGQGSFAFLHEFLDWPAPAP